METNDITSAVLAAAVAVHRKLGPGLLESAYETFVVGELTKRKLTVQRQVPIPIEVDGVRVDCGYRIDILVKGNFNAPYLGDGAIRRLVNGYDGPRPRDSG